MRLFKRQFVIKNSRRLGFIAAALVLNGCSTKFFLDSANREVKSIIAQKSTLVPQMDPEVNIDRPEPVDLSGLPVNNQTFEYFGDEAQLELGFRVINLETALDLAYRYNRNYLSQKEVVFLQALNLALARDQYTPIFRGTIPVDYQSQQREVAGSVDRLTTQSQWTGGGNFGGDWLLKTGGSVAASATADFLNFVSGGNGTITSSRLAATFSQPLWRGSGYLAAVENLNQSERSMLYALRNFTQYRRQFSVDVADSYYRVLQARDQVRNSFSSYQQATVAFERTQARASEGLATQNDLARNEQQQLQFQSSWINAIRNYRDRLDQFKIDLGLSTEAEIILEQTELDKLEITENAFGEEEAIRVALVSRLDLHSTFDQLEDSLRAVKLAANGLKMDVDLNAGASVTSDPNNNTGFPELDFSRYQWSAGLDFNLPLERTRDRNNYRSSLISLERSRRQAELAVDQIKREIRNHIRSLQQGRRDYEISTISYEIQAKEVRHQEILVETGRGSANDLNDAQTNLLNAKNSRTSQLVNFTISKLRLFQDMGILYILPNGQWEPIQQASINP